MARPLRIIYPNAWYHVMNRGGSKVTIFHDDNDYQNFLDLLLQLHRRYCFEIHAYCLMPNHYHLLVRTPLANLSRGMRHLDGLYTQQYNKKYNKDGALLRGRYKSILVDAENYLLRLSRYIHLNPVKAKLKRHPAKYVWSSYQFYCNKSKSPDWLYTNEILAYFGNKQQKNKYSLFVMEQTDQELEIFYNKIKLLPVLGSEEFNKQIKLKYLRQKTKYKEIPEVKKVQSRPSIARICRIVADYYNVPVEQLYTSRRPSSNLPRAAAIYLAAEFTGVKFKHIAEFFKNISDRGVAQIVYRINNLKTDKKDLANDLDNLEHFLLSIVKT